jgi:CRISPR-associated endonuclease/helicase Cas3
MYLKLKTIIYSSSEFSLKSHPRQLLRDHLLGVTEIALRIFDSQFCEPDKREAIRKICMAHDFGKGTSFFQKYINHIERGELKEAKSFGSEKDHSLLSALFAYWWLPKEYKLFGFIAVKKHHGDIKNVYNEYVSVDSHTNLKKQIIDIQRLSQTELEHIYDVDLDEFFEFVSSEESMEYLRDQFYGEWEDRFSIEAAFDLHQLHSYLLSGDKLQLIRETPILPAQKPAWYVEKYKDSVRKDRLLEKPDIVDSEIFKIREEIFADLQTELTNVDLSSESFFSINVPTGAGKTFLAYYTALYISNKISGRSSVIYALPYMSIIDQNYDELLNIIKFNQSGEDPTDAEVLKHHSLSEVKYETSDKEYKDFDARFCYDNWQSQIITTTFVQLWNTIFKIGANSIAHRFNRLINAVIILDEVQAINDKFHAALCIFFEIVAKRYNTKFIFVTATMPLLNDSHELVPNKKDYFNRLNRIALYNHTIKDTSLEEFKQIVVDDINKRSDKSFLIVMNTIASSKEICKFIEKAKVDKECVYLSTEIYPTERLEKIKYIKNSGKKLILVSTQLIEAGVDIDFDIVYRDFAPLSSINQTAGRANRNGLGKEVSEVHIYRLKGEDDHYFYSIYPTFITEITRELLVNRDIIPENEIFNLNQAYAAKVFERVSPDRSAEIIKYTKSFEFENLRRVTQLIDDEYAYKHDIIIEADDKCENLLEELKNIKSLPGDRWKRKFEIQSLFRRLNQYKISVYDKTYLAIESDLKRLESFDIEYLSLKSVDGRCLYSKNRGIILRDDCNNL